jgi:hypothetical protein
LGLVAIDEIFHRAAGMVLNHIYLRRPRRSTNISGPACAAEPARSPGAKLAAAFGNLPRATTLINYEGVGTMSKSKTTVDPARPD